MPARRYPRCPTGGYDVDEVVNLGLNHWGFVGDFEGEAVGLGPGFIWFPSFVGRRLAMLGKRIRDLSATNGFESDFGTVTVA